MEQLRAYLIHETIQGIANNLSEFRNHESIQGILNSLEWVQPNDEHLQPPAANFQYLCRHLI
jgi:hypothetical protein